MPRDGTASSSAQRDSLRRLLVVDDEAGIRASLADYFCGLGYEVDTATDLHQAVVLLDRFAYQAVLTDLRLAGGDDSGLRVVAHARGGHPQSACIVLTAFGDAGSELCARQLGADALLQKPLPLPRIAARIAEILAARD